MNPNILICEYELINVLSGLTKAKIYYFRYFLKHNPVLEEIKDKVVDDHSLKMAVWNLLCSNPVHVFQLIKRLRFFEENIDPLLRTTSCKNKFLCHLFSIHYYQHEIHLFFFFIAYQSLHTVIKRTKWPSDVDFKGVIHGLLRVQYTYHLDICKFFTYSLTNKKN